MLEIEAPILFSVECRGETVFKTKSVPEWKMDRFIKKLRKSVSE